MFIDSSFANKWFFTAVVILLGFLACCRVLSLESGVPYVVVLVFSCLVCESALVIFRTIKQFFHKGKDRDFFSKYEGGGDV